MSDLRNVIVSCSRWEEIVAAKNRAVVQIPRENRNEFNRVFSTYAYHYGLEGAFERMNNRSVATILAEYDDSLEPTPIDSGNVDGYTYKLYDPPNSDENSSGETEIQTPP